MSTLLLLFKIRLNKHNKSKPSCSLQISTGKNQKHFCHLITNSLYTRN